MDGLNLRGFKRVIVYIDYTGIHHHFRVLIDLERPCLSAKDFIHHRFSFWAIRTYDFCNFERKIAFAFLEKQKIIKIFIVQNAEKAEISEDFRRLS